MVNHISTDIARNHKCGPRRQTSAESQHLIRERFHECCHMFTMGVNHFRSFQASAKPLAKAHRTLNQHASIRRLRTQASEVQDFFQRSAFGAELVKQSFANKRVVPIGRVGRLPELERLAALLRIGNAGPLVV